MGVVGIRIHGLEDVNGKVSSKGANPFYYVTVGNGVRMSTIVKCYDPSGSNSKARYDWIKQHLENAVEEAIKIRDNY